MNCFGGCQGDFWIIILLLFCCCGNGNGMLGTEDNSCIWIILLLLLCCGNNKSISSGCGC